MTQGYSSIFFRTSFVVFTHLGRLIEAILMGTHNVCFQDGMRGIVPNCPLYTLVSWNTDRDLETQDGKCTD